MGVFDGQETLSQGKPAMTILEMYQEIETQKLEDLKSGYTDQDFYDDCYSLPEVDYTTQE